MLENLKDREFRGKLFDIEMQLALLRSKEGNPLYNDEIKKLREKLKQVKAEYTKYKSSIYEERKEMKR